MSRQKLATLAQYSGYIVHRTYYICEYVYIPISVGTIGPNQTKQAVQVNPWVLRFDYTPFTNKNKCQTKLKLKLKGEYEDYTLGYGQNPLDFPLLWVSITFSSVDPSFSIAKTILVRFLTFHIFTTVENQPLKQRLNNKDALFLKLTKYFLIR